MMIDHWKKVIEDAKGPGNTSSQCLVDVGRKLGFITEGASQVEAPPVTAEKSTSKRAKRKKGSTTA